MLLELLVFLVIVVAVHWWDYSRAVQEYSFTQPATLDKHGELSGLLQEKTPIAVEIGTLPWRPKVVENASWMIQTEGGLVPISVWSKEPIPARIQDEKGEGDDKDKGREAIANTLELTTGLGDLDAGRPWWWLPTLRNCSVDLLQTLSETQPQTQTHFQIVPLTWVTAERCWIGCTHGEPVSVWLVHSRYRQFLPSGSGSPSGINPWTLTVSDAPWLGRVQFVEVTVKPGWCLGIPAHWGFAARATPLDVGVNVNVSDPETGTEDGKISISTPTQQNSQSWIWMADQHSPLSFLTQRVKG